MRTELTFKALASMPNRYQLVQLAAKATRALHRPNTRVQDTMNDALERLSAANHVQSEMVMEASLESVSAEQLQAA
ncbi:DNA-directed RNA polymerase subunit omega [Acidicapsa acidisoli]|uniref:DNA-directed RNA polymerase subunit omega n=1 Tax=Acidicapsa acidisoli TaxID=1615681 RepID=UPI0021DFB326|nr:DNA-directed RNA polymerase subunit omega [Acidicapsa acidisoli]